ncbi:nucleotide exchange factor GrpE [Halothece sp. PCC 7418]|uniref:nucleotide exchange factor GrpE n=1 Tax=Halothece sp. (strain PCC 7418) TaxID=65093 RepID=UPI001F31F7EC|nr:nucleotide exchange factor GrpE [Halothece sp. PCC 7418]
MTNHETPQATPNVNGETDDQQPVTAEVADAQPVEGETEQEAPPREESANTEQLQGEIQALQQKLEQETQQREAVTAQAKRLAADFENFRRRSETQKEEIKQNEKRETLSKILEIVDNFERARSQIKPTTEGEKNIHKSYQGVYKQLVEALKSLGVSKMRPEGEPFDPYYHEAMLREPSSEYAEGTVIEQLRSGYMLGDGVLRHAMVKVAAAPEPSNEAEENSQNDNEEQPA